MCFDSIGFTAARSNKMGCPPGERQALGWPVAGSPLRTRPGPATPSLSLMEREPEVYRRRSVRVLDSIDFVRIITTKIPPTFMRHAYYPPFFFLFFSSPGFRWSFSNACRLHGVERRGEYRAYVGDGFRRLGTEKGAGKGGGKSGGGDTGKAYPREAQHSERTDITYRDRKPPWPQDGSWCPLFNPPPCVCFVRFKNAFAMLTGPFCPSPL